MQEMDLRIFDKYLFASRWGVPSKEDPPRKDRPSTIVTFA